MFGKPSARSEGKRALAALDKALSQKPERDGHAFAQTTEHLCAMRDLLIADRRGGSGDQDTLERLNAVISSALAGHFPLGNTPWPEVEKARDVLKELLAET